MSLTLLGPGCGEDRWHYGEARRTLEMKTGIQFYCNLLGQDLVIGGSWVKVLSEQEQEYDLNCMHNSGSAAGKIGGTMAKPGKQLK